MNRSEGTRMGINLKLEKAIGMPEAAKVVPPGRNGKPVHVSSLVRAITEGVDGHKLEALRIGRRWVTSVEAIQRWGEALAAAKGAGPAVGQAERHEGDDARVGRRIEEIGL